MLQIAMRLTLIGAGVAVAIIVTNRFYAEVLECLTRVVKIVDAAIPAILAVALLYHIIRNITERKQ
jgi:hypothetical protein